MSDFAQSKQAAALARLAPHSWRASFDRLMPLLHECLERQRQRRELLDFMAHDYRAASDIGVTPYEARKWAKRPFWRA
jgi:uncharacterized protein YjiS (DUF1127 family)